MTLKEAITVARKVLFGEIIGPLKKAEAYQKLAGLHSVLDDLKALDGDK